MSLSRGSSLLEGVSIHVLLPKKPDVRGSYWIANLPGYLILECFAIELVASDDGSAFSCRGDVIGLA